jgi:hypothetical protein
MTQAEHEAELLDALARAIDAPRRDGRLDAIRRAFAAYTEALADKKSWWVKLFK